MSELDRADIARRGWEIYERDVKPHVEPEHADRFLALAVDTGSYALGDDELNAVDRARQRMPEGTFYVVRIGHRVAHRIGRQSMR